LAPSPNALNDLRIGKKKSADCKNRMGDYMLVWEEQIINLKFFLTEQKIHSGP
jgi:hypothetical protein